MNKFNAIAVLSLGLVPVILGLIVLLGNMGDTWTLHVITKDFTASRSAMIIVVAVFGWGIVKLGVKFIPKGAKMIKTAWAKSEKSGNEAIEKDQTGQQEL